MYKIASFLMICLLLGCRSDKKRVDQVLSLQKLQELSVVEIAVREIVHVPDLPFLLSMEAVAQSGIDFSKIDSSSIKVDGKMIRILLPKPTMISYTIDPNSLEMEYSENMDPAIKLNGDQKNAILETAEKQLQQTIDSVQILEQAQIKTTAFLSTYLQSLGYTQISIRYHNTTTHEEKN